MTVQFKTHGDDVPSCRFSDAHRLERVPNLRANRDERIGSGSECSLSSDECFAYGLTEVPVEYMTVEGVDQYGPDPGRQGGNPCCRSSLGHMGVHDPRP